MPRRLGFSPRPTCLSKLLFLALSCATGIQAGNLVKLRVSGRDASLQAVGKLGGRLVADYGAFQILEVDEGVAGTLLKAPGVSLRDDLDNLAFNTGKIRTSSVEARLKAAQQPESFQGKRLHVVQFAGPVKPEWRESLVASGVKIIGYLPENAYLVYGKYEDVSAVHALARTSSHVQWTGSYQDAYKIQPEVGRYLQQQASSDGPAPDGYTIQLVDDPEANAGTLELVDRLRQGAIRRDDRLLGFRNLVVPLRAEDVALLAARPEVVSIHAWHAPKLHCERQDMIISGSLVTQDGITVPSLGTGYLDWLAAKGFTQAQFDTSGFVVDVCDSGVDNATTNPNHFGLHTGGSVSGASRVAYSRLEGTASLIGSTLQGCDGHGTLNAHIIAGYNDYGFSPQRDASGYHYGLGVCPFVKVGSSVAFDPSDWTSPDIPSMIARAYRDGARISSNSWGEGSAYYTSECQAYDALVRDAQQGKSVIPTAGNQEMTIVFSAGNDGPASGSIGSPANAKNVIAVGASEDVNSFGGSDGSGISDSGADNAMDLASFSSRGPSTDGRTRPDLVAPGTHVSGGVFQASRVNPTEGATGEAASCFNASGISGGPNGSPYFPTTQQWFSASSGTSHSCPAVAGACALLRQYFTNHSLDLPSPAMTKAFLMNSARYMTGTGAGDTLPSNSQGMGLLDLGRAFDGTARILKDQTERFTASGQTRTVIGTLADASKPFRVTLAWTDAPGTTSSAPWVNNLDLTVTVGGTTYQGNVFSGAYSTTGGSADIRNNVESVFLPAGVTGTFQVTITAINIAGDGVPNNEDVVDQDYALVVYNATEAPVPVIAVSASQLTSESSTPANSMPDPGEAVTYQFTFKNTGAAAANALTISLADTGGVTAASSALPLGTLAVQGSATGTFSFTVDPSKAVGSALPLTFTVKDGTTDLGTMTHTLTTGYFSPSITSFKPAPGSQGIIVTITGTHFTGTTAVKFNGMLAKTVTVASDAQITATAPSGFTTGPITVTTPGGTATSADSLKGLDLDGKGSVDVADMAVLAKAFGSSSGSPVYEDAADLDNDLKVGDSDLKLWLAGF